MRTLYHGTTLSNYENILKNGFGGESVVWYCSDLDATYFYDASKTNEDEDMLINNAFQSAMITAAVQNYKGESLVVIKIEIDDDFVYDDDSCPNMEDVASYVYNTNLTKEHIVKVFISDDGYCPSLRLFYVSGLINNNDFINTNNFSRVERDACLQICKSNIFLDNIYIR